MPKTGECHTRKGTSPIVLLYCTLYKYLHGAYVLSRFRGQPHWGPQKGEEGILCLKDSREGNVVEGGIEGTLGKGEEGMGREVCRGEGDSEEGCIQGHGRD